MPKIQKKVSVDYNSEQIYALVCDYASYPQFVPNCVSGEVLREYPLESAVDVCLSFEKSGMTQSFTTKNTLSSGHSIRVDLVEGPFNTLQGEWTFTDSPTGCEVGVELEFEFSNMMYKMMFSSLFDKIISDLIEAFVARAGELYG